MGMQGQIIGLQSSLDRILNAIQPGAVPQPMQAFSNRPYEPTPPPSSFSINAPESPRDLPGFLPSSLIPSSSSRGPPVPLNRAPRPQSPFYSAERNNGPSHDRLPTQQNFPPLPGFAPPVRSKVVCPFLSLSFDPDSLINLQHMVSYRALRHLPMMNPKTRSLVHLLMHPSKRYKVS